jgi:hypothetical protein
MPARTAVTDDWSDAQLREIAKSARDCSHDVLAAAASFRWKLGQNCLGKWIMTIDYQRSDRFHLTQGCTDKSFTP